MDYLAIIISFIALIGAGFAFLRANSSHNILSKRIETLKDRIGAMELRLRKLEGNSGRGKKVSGDSDDVDTVRKKQPRQERQEPQNEPRQKQSRQEQQERPPRQAQQNEPRQKQPRQEQQPDPRQKQREKQQPRPERQQQEQQASPPLAQQETEGQQESQQPQQKRRRENRRRNEGSDRGNFDESGNEQPMPVSKEIKLEVAGGDLLDELEQAAVNTAPVNASANTPVESSYPGKKYAIIPEDGVIRGHQMQQQPDSDSYLEVDMPAEGSNQTNYRFNLAGNHAFVIAQGIDRLENAFDFEKPSNRMVNKVVQQQDGVLTKINNGWKIMEKARIDFR